jgi:hypothetical protein
MRPSATVFGLRLAGNIYFNMLYSSPQAIAGVEKDLLQLSDALDTWETFCLNVFLIYHEIDNTEQLMFSSNLSIVYR